MKYSVDYKVNHSMHSIDYKGKYSVDYKWNHSMDSVDRKVR